MQTRKILRSAVAALLAGAMLTGAVSADLEMDTDTEINIGNVSGEASARNHVLENIEEYLYMFDYDMEGVSISEIYPIYTFGKAGVDTEFYICFVIKNGEVIADLAISKYNGSYYSTLELCDNSYADNALKNNTPISFAADGENLYMVSGENACVISSDFDDEGEIYSVSELKLPAITQSVMTAYEIPQTYSTQASDDVITRDKYRVPIVDNNGGICWAACIASKVMYEVVKYMNSDLSADDVYGVYKEKYGEPEKGIGRYIKGLALYNITAYNHSNRILLSADNLVSKASNSNMTIFRLTKGSADHIGHAVLFAGCLTVKSSSGAFKSCKYYFMDPNKTSYVSVDVTSSMYAGQTGFVYTTDNGTVYTYFDSVYNS